MFVTERVLIWLPTRRRIHGHGGMVATGVHNVETHAEDGAAVFGKESRVDGIPPNALSGVHSRVLGGHPVAEVFDDQIGRQII